MQPHAHDGGVDGRVGWAWLGTGNAAPVWSAARSRPTGGSPVAVKVKVKVKVEVEVQVEVQVAGT